MFAFQDKRGRVEVAFTDRYLEDDTGLRRSELNLLERQDRDDPESEQVEVDFNVEVVSYAMERGAWAPTYEKAFDLPIDGQPPAGIVFMRQVHGAHVEVLGRDVRGPDPLQEDPVADGIVTAAPGWILAARAADCVPVLLADAEQGVVGAVHAGRKGVEAGVVLRAAEVMRALGAEHLVAWIGPHACGRCYEVPAEMRDAVSAVVPESRSETSWGTPALDLGAGVAAQLRSVGAEVIAVERCTIEDESLFSYRREGAEAGRHAGVIWVRP